MSRTNVMNSTSQNEGFFALPAPVKPVIDGDLSEWDWSGRIRMFADYDSLDIYYNETAAMYDNDNLYLAFKVTDDTPMENIVNPYHEGELTWRGDCVQLRMTTDRHMWLTLAWCHELNVGSLYTVAFNGLAENLRTNHKFYAVYITGENTAKIENVIAGFGEPASAEGVALAYKKYEDGKGYCIEARLPWTFLYDVKPEIKKDLSLKMGIQTHWNDPAIDSFYGFEFTDNMAPGYTSRVFYYLNPAAWGSLTLTDENDILPREYLVQKNTLFTGTLPITFDVPKDAEVITVVAEKNDGSRVGPVVSALPVSRYITEEKGETNAVTVCWNGLDAYGNPAGEGDYVFKAIVHNGLKMKYDATYYNPGTPPWRNTPLTGDWGADHVAPCSVCACGSLVYIGWPFAEGGSALLAVGENGKKVWGSNRGARLATAVGDYVYSIATRIYFLNDGSDPPPYDQSDTPLTRFNRHTGKLAPFIRDGKELPFEITLKDVLGGQQVPFICDLASYGDMVVLVSDGRLFAIDALTAKHTVHIPLDFLQTDPSLNDDGEILYMGSMGIKNVGYYKNVIAEFDQDGNLYLATKNQVYKGRVLGGAPFESVSLDLGDAVISDLTFDQDGNIVIFDRGPDCQIKAFSSKTGKLIYTAGKKGGRDPVGRFDKNGLIRAVTSIAVDNGGQIWAVENWEAPRRVSVWSKGGSFVREYVGSTAYAGLTVSLHMQDADTAYTGAVEMKYDRGRRAYEVSNVAWVPDFAKGERFPIKAGSHSSVFSFRSSASGKERAYIFAPLSSTGHSRYGVHALYMETGGGKYKPVFAMGSVNALTRPGNPQTVIGYDKDRDISKQFPIASMLKPCDTFIWNDENGDGIVQESECLYYTTTNHVSSMPVVAGSGNGISISDLKFALTSIGGKLAVYEPTGFRDDGAPIYKMPDAMTYFGGPEYPVMFGRSANLVEGTDDVVTFTDSPSKNNGIGAFDIKNNLKLKWFHKNDYPGVGGSHSAPMQRENGFVIGPIKMLGFLYGGADGSEALFALRGNLGCDYVFTTDGYYVATLFKDGRLPCGKMPDTEEEMYGRIIDDMDLTEGGEPFGGWAGTQSDGRSFMETSLARHAGLFVEIMGLDTLKRLPAVTGFINRDDMEAAHRAFYAEQEKAGIKRNEYAIHKSGAEGPDWGGADYLEIKKEGAVESCRAAVLWDDKNLYARFDVQDDASPMINNGLDFQKLFKTGDVAEIQISPSNNSSNTAASGDMRLLFSVYGGKPVCVLMMPENPLKNPADRYAYGTWAFDTVKILAGVSVDIKRGENSYEVTAVVPLAEIGLKIYDGMEVRGDAGIITSDIDGQINQGRYYYFNEQTGLTSDLPCEAALNPNLWGRMVFKG